MQPESELKHVLFPKHLPEKKEKSPLILKCRDYCTEQIKIAANTETN